MDQCDPCNGPMGQWTTATALKGHGATVRYVTLPYKAPGYAARESNLQPN